MPSDNPWRTALDLVLSVLCFGFILFSILFLGLLAGG